MCIDNMHIVRPHAHTHTHTHTHTHIHTHRHTHRHTHTDTHTQTHTHTHSHTYLYIPDNARVESPKVVTDVALRRSKLIGEVTSPTMTQSKCLDCSHSSQQTMTITIVKNFNSKFTATPTHHPLRSDNPFQTGLI